MTKEEALGDFLKSLKATFNNASAYEKDHPYFIKSVENFLNKVNGLFSYLSPIQIAFTFEALLVEDMHVQKSALSDEVAAIFHQRKIMSLEIRKGITLEEMVYFLSGISMPPRKLLRAGGALRLVDEKLIPHIRVKEVDYSQLLTEGGEELKDIWVFLLGDVVAKKDPRKISEIVGNFDKIIGKFKADDILEDTDLNKNVMNFLGYLKGGQSEDYKNCSMALIRQLLRGQDITGQHKIDEAKRLLKGFDADIFSDTLWEETLKDQAFSSLSFKLFSTLVERNKHQEIADVLAKKAKTSPSIINNAKARKRISDLFAQAQNNYILEIYRHALDSIFKDDASGKEFRFDRDGLRKNFRLILLNIVSVETNKEKLSLVVEKMTEEIDRVLGDRDFEYLSYLFDICGKRKKEDPSLADLFEKIEGRITNLIENLVFREDIQQDIEYFIDALQKSSLNVDFYLNKVFNEDKVNPNILKLFLRFFPQDLPLFYSGLDKRSSDLEFLQSILESLENVNKPVTIDILKYIFSISNNIIKIEVLRAMQELHSYDKEFLLAILSGRDPMLKKEALLALIRDEATKREALEALLSIPSPWGKKNETILENIIVVEELDLREAKERLAALGKRWFFWNGNIRRKAREVLERWDVREN